VIGLNTVQVGMRLIELEVGNWHDAVSNVADIAQSEVDAIIVVTSSACDHNFEKSSNVLLPSRP
jgi:hypothetical protein